MRGRPRLWDHDYLHLRPLAADLAVRLAGWGRPGGASHILDLGSGGAPYRGLIGKDAVYVRCDLDGGARPDVAARAERLPFADGAFEAVLATQVLEFVSDPRGMVAEIARVLRPGGQACVTTPAAFPYDDAVPAGRFGEPQLRALFFGLTVTEIVPQGGMMGLPFLLLNVGVREVTVAARRRLGPMASVLRPFASAIYVVSNVAGRTLERLAAGGPLAPFLGYLDRRMPMNFLVTATKA